MIGRLTAGFELGIVPPLEVFDGPREISDCCFEVSAEFQVQNDRTQTDQTQQIQL